MEFESSELGYAEVGRSELGLMGIWDLMSLGVRGGFMQLRTRGTQGELGFSGARKSGAQGVGVEE